MILHGRNSVAVMLTLSGEMSMCSQQMCSAARNASLLSIASGVSCTFVDNSLSGVAVCIDGGTSMTQTRTKRIQS